MSTFTIADVPCGGDSPLLLIAGPCQVEGLDHALMCAEALAGMAADAGIEASDLFIGEGDHAEGIRVILLVMLGSHLQEGVLPFLFVGVDKDRGVVADDGLGELGPPGVAGGLTDGGGRIENEPSFAFRY